MSWRARVLLLAASADELTQVVGSKSVSLRCPIQVGRGCLLLVEVAVHVCDGNEQEGMIAVGKATQAQTGRDRAREARLRAARERRLRLDPEQLAREQRIDEAVVDVEVAWEARSEAEQAVAAAGAEAATERLIDEKLAVKDVVRLTGMDQATVHRLRQLYTETDDGTTKDAGTGAGKDVDVAAETAGVRVA